MAGNELTIRISAQDDASKVFQTLAKTAQTVADSLEAAGEEGASGFKEVETGAARANSSLMKLDSTGTGVIRTFDSMGSGLDRFVSGITTAGSGLETFGRTLDTLGQSYISQERQIDGVARAYGDASDRALDFADRLQDQIGVTDDAVRQSELIASSLVTNYQLSFDQIEQLIARSADLAQIFGISLEDAVQRTSSALRGEGESAELLSLNMSDAAVSAAALNAGITNWNVPGALSESEKAAFRFKILMEQSSYATGAASDAAQNAAGKWRMFGAELQDAAQQAGAFVGPWGDIIGTTGGGLATLGQAAQGIREVVEGLKSLKAFAASGIGTFGLIGAAVGVASYGVVKMIGDIHDLESATKALDRLDVEFEIKGEFDKQKMLEDVRSTFTDAVKELSTFTGFGDVSNELKAQIGAVFAEAFADPSVDSAAFANWFTSNIQTLIASGDDQALRDFIKTAADPAVLDQFRGSVDAAADSVENLGEVAKATAADIKGIFSDLPASLDDLRIDGKGALADQLDNVHKGIIEAFTPSTQEVAYANRETLKMLPAEDQQALLDGLTNKTDLSTEAAGRLDTAWTRISQNMQSGLLDNAALIQDINSVLSDDSLSGDQKVAEIERISLSMSQYIDKYAQLKDAQVEWLANGDNFLNWWQAYDEALRSNQKAMIDGTATAEQLAAVNEKIAAQKSFRLDVEIADGVQEASQALDQVLRTFGEIDALGQRSASAGSIADKLIGAPGELGELQDLWDRISAGTSDAALSVEDYNRAIESGIAIQESNVRVQDDLNVVRAKQMPLLQQEQAAYEANISRIASLNAVEARRVLLLQDTAVQSQVAALYSQAYAAAIGEVPKDVTTKMILEAAEADAGLKDLLLNLGLIQQNADGTISVNFPDAESVGASIDRVTLALLHMQALTEGKSVYQLAVEIYGEEEARRLLGMVDEADGKTATTTFTVVSQGLDEAGNTVETIKLADGTQITVVVGVDGLDQLGKADSDIKAVTLADGTVVTVKTDVDTSGWDKKSFQDLINGGQAVEVETTLKPPTGWTVDDWNNSDGEGSTGGLPDIEIGTKAKPITETPEYQGGEVEVKGKVSFLGADGGPGSGGYLDPANWGVQPPEIPVKGKVESVEPPAEGTDAGTVDVKGKVTDVEVPETVSKTITVDADTSAAMEKIANIGAALDTMSTANITIPVSVSMDDTGSTLPGWLLPYVPGAAGEGAASFTPITMTVTLEATDNASPKIEAASTLLAGKEGQMSTMIIDATDNATAKVDAASNNLAGLEGQMSTMYVAADTSDAEAGIGWAQGYDGTVLATSYIDIVTRTSTVNYGGGSGLNERHGGIPAYASGGVLFEAGEAGPELAHFAGGGVALIPSHDFYMAPQGTRIEPANSVATKLTPGNGLGGSPVINLTINGNIYGIDDLEEQLTRSIMTAFRDEVIRSRRAAGVL